MITTRDALRECASIAAEDLPRLAGLLDQAIRDMARQRADRKDRKNGLLEHAIVRENVAVALDGGVDSNFEKLVVRTSKSDGMRIKISGVGQPIPLTARPKTTRTGQAELGEDEQEDALFPSTGYLRLFYTIRDGRLGGLSLVLTRTSPEKYYADCEIVEELRIPMIVALRPRDDTDTLDGMTYVKDGYWQPTNTGIDTAASSYLHDHHSQQDEEGLNHVDRREGDSAAG